MTERVEYRVPDMSCEHCRKAVTEALTGCEGVENVDVDLETKLVTVTGTSLDDAALRSALDEAGYEAS
jgi:copper chaperone